MFKCSTAESQFTYQEQVRLSNDRMLTAWASYAHRPNTVAFLYAREGLKLPTPGRRAHALGQRAVAA